MAVLLQHDRLDELVGDLARVGFPDRRHGIGRRVPLAACHRPIGARDTLPAIIAIHRIIATRDARHLGRMRAADLAHARQQLPYVVHRTDGRGIAPIGERVNVRALDSVRRRQLEAGFQVRLMGVHAAWPDHAAKVQLAAVALDVLDRLHQRRIGEEGAIVDGGGDAGELLQHTLARAEVEVADLRVAHLAFWQADCRTGRGEPGVWPLAGDAVEVGLPGHGNGVGFRARVNAVSVHHDEHERARHLRHEGLHVVLCGAITSGPFPHCAEEGSRVRQGREDRRWPASAV